MPEALVAARLDSGESVVFEVDEPEDFGVTAVSISVDQDTGVVELGKALGSVKRAAGQVLETMRSIADPPDSCEVSFGVKLSGTVGAIIAKASTEANFTIKLTWMAKRDS